MISTEGTNMGSQYAVQGAHKYSYAHGYRTQSPVLAKYSNNS